MREMRKFLALVGLSDVVIGFRNQKQYTPYRKITSFTYNLVLRTLFDLPYQDVNCSFKLVSRSLIEQISLDSDKFFVDAELLLKARRLDQRITEVGVTHSQRQTGVASVNTKGILDTIEEMVRFYLSVRLGKRKKPR